MSKWDALWDLFSQRRKDAEGFSCRCPEAKSCKILLILSKKYPTPSLHPYDLLNAKPADC